MTHKLEPKYRSRLKELEHLHPPAFCFLTRLDEEGRAHQLRLSTSTHAHVYKRSAYLMRVELEGRGRDRDNIVLSPRPHLRIEESATDMAHLLFPKVLTNLVMKHGGYKGGWAPRGTPLEIILTPSTPDAFFISLFDHLAGLEVEP